MMESDSTTSSLFNQVSILQLLLLTALAAIIIAALAAISFHSATIYAFLFAPTVFHFGLRTVGVFFRPALWLAKQPALFLSVGVIVFLGCWLVRSPPTFLVLIPIATIWGLQIAVASAIEGWMNAGHESHSRTRRRAELMLVGLCGLFALCCVGIRVFTLSNHVTGKGCVFDSYWMVSLANDSAHYDWQTGYGEQPWRCRFAPNATVSGHSNPKWSLFGLRVYQLSPRRSIVHIHYALTIVLASLFPLIWFSSNYKRLADGLTLQRNREPTNDAPNRGELDTEPHDDLNGSKRKL